LYVESKTSDKVRVGKKTSLDINASSKNIKQDVSKIDKEGDMPSNTSIESEDQEKKAVNAPLKVLRTSLQDLREIQVEELKEKIIETRNKSLKDRETVIAYSTYKVRNNAHYI